MAKVYIHLVLSLALLGVICGCRHSKEGQPAPEQVNMDQIFEQKAKIDQFVWDGTAILDHKTLSQVRKLGALRKEKLSVEENPNNDGHKIAFRSFEFDGLSMTGTFDKGEFDPISVTVTSPKWPILHGLNVGSAASIVPNALGQPSRPMNGPVEELTGETETVRFTVEQGKIVKIEFLYYFD